MLEYLTIFDFYPRGSSVLAIGSRTLCGNIKAGRELTIRRRIEKMVASRNIRIREFLNPEVTLVPVPRSSPISDSAIWPALQICKSLLDHGLARDIATLIERRIPLRKASLQPTADLRPSVNEHYKSILVNRDLGPFTQFTLVDDVLTQGRTTYACFQRLQEVFPSVEVRVFTLARTRSFESGPITDIFNITFGCITYNPNSGKTFIPE